MPPKVINFAAGPAKLPEEVLLEVQQELLNYSNTGISIMEMSHRSADFANINNNCQNSLRTLLNVPDNYEILFMQGGGTGLFAAVAMNLMSKTGTADYIVTGTWSKKAAKEASKYGKVNLVLPETKVGTIQDQSEWNLSPDASFVYYCDNETVDGVEFPFIPETGNVPLVVDMSSNFLTRAFDVSKFGAVFAGAQKNFGPSGIVVVIVRNDLLGNALPITPSVFDFSLMAKEKSLLNTPPTFQVYTIWRVFEWIKRNGGVEGMEERSRQKSSIVYEAIRNSSGFYESPIDENVRSRVNIPFKLSGGAEADVEFLKGASKLGMIQLKGHRSVGGVRVSLYNAITLEETKMFVDYMNTFTSKFRK